MTRSTRQEIAVGLIPLAVLTGCAQPPTEAEKMLITVVESAGPVAAKAAHNKIKAKTAVLAMGKEAG